MQIVTSKRLPPIPEIAEVLKKELSSHYSYVPSLEEQSIWVTKSSSIKAQILLHNDQLFIQAISLSLFETIVANLCGSDFGLVFIPLFYRKGMKLLSQKTELEQEIGLFLDLKYNHHDLKAVS